MSPPAGASALAYIGLGGNVGDVPATLAAALPALDELPDTRLLSRSWAK